MNTKLEKPPIFIVGHWRSGTTHLHNLFIQDDDLAYPNMIDSLFPRHNISSKFFLRPSVSLALPNKRPMDNMKLNVDVPGEHDWSITNLCLLSPYSGAYFPNHWDKYFKYANFREATDKEKQQYRYYLKFFIKKLTYKYKGKQLVLKSPMDTARVKLLYNIFPEAKFVHIYRNPYEVFFSTKKLHLKNREIFPFQNDKRDLDEFVLDTYKKVYTYYYEDIDYIPKSQIIEISYDELTNDRINTMREIYGSLNLDNFSEVKPQLEQYVKSLKHYEVDDYGIDQKDVDMIYENWKFTIDKWGYNTQITSKTH